MAVFLGFFYVKEEGLALIFSEFFRIPHTLKHFQDFL